jgi:hypothetical protein
MKFKPGTLIRYRNATGAPQLAHADTFLVLDIVESEHWRLVELGEMPHYLILWNEHVEYWKVIYVDKFYEEFTE